MNTHQHAHHHHAGSADSPWVTSAQATLHCLTGCVIGEVAGLMIGVSLGMGVMQTMALATVLAYISGMTLGVVPVMRARNLPFLPALKIIWIGEVISIGVMELVMNSVDYHVGGVQAGSIFELIFWIGIIAAIPAGFIAAWPVNWWLLKRNMKACH
ncbi:MAG: DUF4396 domain-containing protein [Xanthomonadales bacterium]|nr:DUF4396 domain-containing protein [Xanthomonadales bacterium]